MCTVNKKTKHMQGVEKCQDTFLCNCTFLMHSNCYNFYSIIIFIICDVQRFMLIVYFLQ